MINRFAPLSTAKAVNTASTDIYSPVYDRNNVHNDTIFTLESIPPTHQVQIVKPVTCFCINAKSAQACDISATQHLHSVCDASNLIHQTSSSFDVLYRAQLTLISLVRSETHFSPVAVIVKRSPSRSDIPNKTSTSSWYEVNVFAHGTRKWKAKQHRLNQLALFRQNDETGDVPICSSVNLLESHLSNYANGVFGPFACTNKFNGTGLAVLPELESKTTISSPTVDSLRVFETTKSDIPDDFTDVVYPDIGGCLLSTKIAAWQGESPNGPSFTTLISMIRCCLAVADQLDRLHVLGIILRTASPSSILYNAMTDQVQFLDFAHITLLHSEKAAWSRSRVLEIPQPLWPYMSPEMTGRINRVVDRRSDIYYAGILFFEILTGQVPFSSNDPVEAISWHVSQAVRFPDIESNSVSVALSALQSCILKALNKSPEERYQTTAGVIYDLRYCLRLAESNDMDFDPKFAPGSADERGRLVVSQRLYGRENDVRQLLAAWDRLQISSNGPQLVLIAGFSGVGKTAVVDEVHRPMVSSRGLFSKAKFDLYRRNSSVLFQAFQGLITQILAGGEIDKWRTRLARSMASFPSCYLLTEVIPNLSAIIGPQARPSHPLPHTEAQSLFQRMLVAFTGTFATAEHPLVLFIDDLQWADSMSMNMIKHLFECLHLRLLVVGAYRSNQVDDVHPLMQMLRELQHSEYLLAQRNADAVSNHPARITLIHLSPLTQSNVSELVCDTLKCDKVKASELIELLHLQTSGNPFFLVMLLHAYNDHGWIIFDHLKDEWCWNLDALHVSEIGSLDSLVALLEQQVKQLRIEQQEIMTACACIGHGITLETLGTISGLDLVNTARRVWPLVQLGFLVPIGSTAEVFALACSNSSGVRLQPSKPVAFRFLHDSVQQASYQLLAEAERLQRHLHIARVLFDSALQNAMRFHSGDVPTALNAALESSLDVVDSFNQARLLLTDPEEVVRVIRLNHVAAERAKSSTAYDRCHFYTGMQCDLLRILSKIEGIDTWISRYRLTFDCWHDHGTSAFLQFSHALAEQISLDLIARVSSATLIHPENDEYRADHAAALLLNALVYGAQPSKAPQCIEQTFKALPLLDVALLVPNSDDWKAIRERDVADWTLLPDASDTHHLHVMNVMASILAVCYLTGHKDRLERIIYTMMSYDLCFGVSIYSSCALSYLSGTLCASEDPSDVGRCVRAGNAGMQLLDRFRSSSLATTSMIVRTVGPYYCISSPWGAHLSVSIPAFAQIRVTAVDGGEFEYAGYCMWHLTALRFYAGEPLGVLERDVKLLHDGAVQAHQNSQADYAMMTLQHVQKLLRKASPDDLFSFDGMMMTDEHFSNRWLDGGTDLFAHFLITYRIQLRYLAQDFVGAMALVPVLRKTRNSCAGLVYFAYDLYFSALAQIRAVPLPESLIRKLVRVIDSQEADEENCRDPSVPSSHSQIEQDAESVAIAFVSTIRSDVMYAMRRCEAWAVHAPMNFSHRVHLLKAEWIRLQSLTDARPDLVQSAMYRYRMSAQLATEHSYTQDTALALELHGRYCADLGMFTEAAGFLARAFNAYESWHCILKTDQLRNEFGSHKSILAATAGLSSSSGLLWSALNNGSSEDFVEASPSSSETNVAEEKADLDLLTILRFAQTFSVQKDTRGMLRIAMSTMLRSSGAERGVLVLASTEKKGDWNVELLATLLDGLTDQNSVTDSNDLVTTAENVSSLLGDVLPLSVFQYVVTCHEILVVSNPLSLSMESELVSLMSDPYFHSHTPRAFLCMPVLQRGEMIGALYLESPHPDALHASQTLLLQMLCSQAVLCLYNERLCRQLELKNMTLQERSGQLEDRRSELEARNIQLIASKEETERISQVKANFLASMSHEIRTPLNAVLGASRLLETTSMSMEQQQYMMTINTSGQLLLSIVNDILDYSKMQSGEVQLRLEPNNLAHVVESTILQCYGQAAAKGLNLSWYVDPIIPPNLLLDNLRLQQILLNLLSNAIKFTKQGMVRLSVSDRWLDLSSVNEYSSPALTVGRFMDSPHSISKNPNHCTQSLGEMKLYFQIHDTGIGISAVQLPKLFKSFSQVHHNSGEYGGTGLGLVISERLVTAMGGTTIDVDSELGRGSIFSFCINCHNSAGGVEPAQTDFTLDLYGISEAEYVQLRHLRCLFVGDSLACAFWVRILRSYGCSVDSAGSIDAAVAHVKSSTIDPGILSESSAKPGSLVPTVHDVFVIDLDTPGIHENTMLNALAFISPVRLLFLYSHPHVLRSRSFGPTESNGLTSKYTASVSPGDASLTSLSPKLSTRTGSAPLYTANLLHFPHHSQVCNSMSSKIDHQDPGKMVLHSIRKDLAKPFKSAFFLKSILELTTEPFLPPISAVQPKLQTSSMDSSASLNEVSTSINPRQENQKPSRQSINKISSYFPLRILLAEDNIINQKIMVMLLRKLGYEILVAINGADAVQTLEREASRGRSYEIECILMDASMDVMDGMECTRVIRAQQMSHRIRPYIVAQTANVTEDYRRQCTESGMDEFIAKPILLDELTQSLCRAYRALH